MGPASKFASFVRLLVLCPTLTECFALFYSTDIGESFCTVPGLHRERAKGDAPTIRDRRHPNLTPVSPLTYWGVRVLTLHLNYVAGCTDPLLFLSERTYNYYVDNQGLVTESRSETSRPQ